MAATSLHGQLIRTLLALALAAILTATGAHAQTTPPRVSRIEIRRDTVGFVVADEDHSLAVRFGYVRATGEWLAMNRRPGRWRERVPRDSTDKVALGGGYSLQQRRRFPGTVDHQTKHVLVDSIGRVYELQAHVDSAVLRGVLGHYGRSEADYARGFWEFSRHIQNWRREGDTLWLANWGNWAALLRFNTKTHQLQAFTAPWVAHSIVHDFALTRRAGWLALRDASGTTGLALARYDRADGTWRRFSPSNSPLPDSNIVAMDGTGDTLWIATEEALAVYDDARDRWDVRWFRAEPRIVARETRARFDDDVYVDSVVRPHWTIAPQLDSLEYANRVIIDVARALESDLPAMNVLDPGAERGFDAVGFMEIARSLPPEHFARAWRAQREGNLSGTDLGLALGHPRLIPLTLYDTAHAITRPTGDELRAIGVVGDRSLLPYVQWAFPSPSSDPVQDAWAAWTRARLGDTTWIPLLRDLAVNRGWLWTGNWMADALAELGDTVILDQILHRIRAEHTPWPYEWVRQRVSAKRWQSLVSEAAETPIHGYVLLTYLQLYARAEVSDDPAIRPHILRSARAALSPGALAEYPPEAKRDIGGLALYFVERFQDTAAIPLLIGLMTRDSATYTHVSALLIRMTGVESVPGGPASPSTERRDAQRFWTRWWAEHRATFEPAAKHAGQAAEARWWRRKR